MDQNIVSNNTTTTTSEEKHQFLDKLRVLVIDDSIVCLKIISSCLEKCNYKVKATTRPTEALEILRKKEEIFDIVITDVKMHEMDGFKLLEIIGLEMDIPVIMISASNDVELVMKGVRHGARDYLVKPVRMEELKNIWQHVVRKNIFNHNISKLTLPKTEDADNNLTIKKTIPVAQSVVHEELCPSKKPRVNWTRVLHHKFVDAIEILGADAFPKKILEFMNVPNLSRENVASHLQKYRKGLKKGKQRLTTETNIVAQDQISTRHDINNIGNAMPLNSNNNQCLIQQNQQLPSTYGNYFHQPTVFTPNPSPWNNFNTPNNIPNHSLVPSIDSVYASFGNVINSTVNNYVGIHRPYNNISCPNSYDVPNLQVTISHPPPIGIPTNPIGMASSLGNMAMVEKRDGENPEEFKFYINSDFEAPPLDDHSLLMGEGLDGNTFENDNLLYNQQQQQEHMERKINTSDELSKIFRVQ